MRDAAAIELAPVPGIAPNPSRAYVGLFWVSRIFSASLALTPPPPPLGVLVVAAAAAVVEAGVEITSCARLISSSLRVFSSAASRSRSYPSCLIRSASSRALRSASAKLTGLALLAPRPSLDFLGPPVALPEVVDEVREEEEEFKRDAVSFAVRAAAEDVIVLGDGTAGAGAGVSLGEVAAAAAAATLGEGDRTAPPRMGGVETRLAGVDDGLGVDGLDQDSKKSSSLSSLTGVSVPLSIPSTYIPFGNLSSLSILERKSSRRTRQNPP